MFAKDGGTYDFSRVNLMRLGIEDLELSRISYRAERGGPAVLLQRCFEEICKKELDRFFEQGYSLYLLLIGGTLTVSEAAKRPNIQLAKTLEALGKESKLFEKRYQIRGNTKYALMAWIDASESLEAFKYTNMRPQSVLIMSRSQLIGEAVLDRLFPLMSITFDFNPSNKVNQGAVCGLRCPHGDILVRSTGEFDDDYRTAEIIFDPRCYNIK